MPDTVDNEQESLERNLVGEETLRLMILGVQDYAIFMLDTNGVIVTWNEGAKRIKGFGDEDIVGRHLSTLYAPDDLAGIKPAEALKIAEDTGHYQGEGWRIRKDGSLFWASVVITALRDKTGHLRGFSKVTRDLTEARRIELAMRENEKKFRLLADNVPQLVWMCGSDGLNIYFNQRWVDYTGLSLEASYGQGWKSAFHPDDKQPAWDAWSRAVAAGANYEFECRLRSKDGSYSWFFIKGLPLLDEKGEVTFWYGTFTEINRLKEKEALLNHLALHDGLTGLLNQRGLSVLADQHVHLTKRTGRPFMVVFVDIDRMKQINDTFGHTVGDEAIVETANILRSGFRQSDIVARIGGDEFVILALESEPSAEATIREKLKLALEAANAQPNRRYSLAFSIGMVAGDPSQFSFVDLLAKADASMYKEKKDKAGGLGHRFNPE